MPLTETPKLLKIQLNSLRDVLKGGPINAYSDEGEARKTRLHYTCKHILKQLAKDLGLPKFTVSSNMSGIAGCGYIQLIAPFFRVQLADGSTMGGRFYYRKETEDSRPAFTAAARNRWWRLEDLVNDYPAFVEECRKVMAEPNI